MPTEIGEYVVGAYLKEVAGCDFVDYNVRPPGGGLRGLGELDVLGLRFQDGTAFLCEVATHLGGLGYGGGYESSAKKVEEKMVRARTYASDQLSRFPIRRFQFWAPRVPTGRLLEMLEAIPETEIIANELYTARVRELEKIAASTTRDTGNPFFRSLQVLHHLRR